MKVGIYIRVSSLSQKENESLDVQRNKGIKFCEYNGYEYEVFEDVVSGTKLGKDRKSFSELESEVWNGNIGGIWIYDWDRGMREMGVGIVMRDFIVESGIKFWVNGVEKDLGSDEGSLEFGIGNVFSDYWRRKIVRVMNNGKYEKWKRGEGFNGRVGLGYKRKNGKVVIDKEKSKIVVDVFKIFLRKDVNSFEEVLRRIRKKYGKVYGLGSSSRVREMLVDEKYLGVYKLKDKSGDEYEFDFGRIIEDEVWDKVKEKFNYVVSLRKGNSRNDYLLKGKVFCEDCSNRMWIRGGGDSNGSVYRYYFCKEGFLIERRKRNFGDYESIDVCESNIKGNNKLSSVKLENVVWDGLFIVLNNSDKIKEEYKSRYRKDLGLKEDNVGKVKYYESELDKWNDRKNKYLNLLLDDDFDKNDFDEWKDNEYEVNVLKIKKKIKGLKKEIERYESVDNIDGYIELMKSDLSRRYNNKRFEFRRKIIEKYVDKVYVKRKDDNYGKVFEIRIKLNFDDDSINDKRIEIDNKNFNVYISKNKDVEVWRL